MTAPLVLICARCQKPLAPAAAQEVDVEQGTSANLLYVHRGTCWPQYVRRSL